MEDAVKFTLLLDRTNHLWVDSLCIAEDAKTKHDQIASMDRIYENAILTVIATGGDNSSYGLSGVSRARLKKPQIRLGSHLMM